MRDDDPDEADQPADGHRCSRADVAATTSKSRVLADVDAECRGFLVAQRHHVEHAPVEKQHDALTRRRAGSA